MIKSIGVVLFVSVWTWSAFAGFKQDPKMGYYHQVNSKVAKLLDPKNSSQIKPFLKSIKSSQDRQLFERHYTAMKGQKISFRPFMNRLLIDEGKKRYVIQLLAVKPLRVKIDQTVVVKIDGKNIYKSINGNEKNKVSSPLMDLLIPRAEAFLFGSSESRWLFMYSAVAESVSQDTKYNGKLAADDQSFSDEVDSFLKAYDIKKFNCSDRSQGRNERGAPIYGISYEDSKNTRHYGGCISQTTNCVLVPLGKDGSVKGAVDEVLSAQEALKKAMKRQAQILADTPSFNINDFEVRCEMAWNTWKTYKRPNCYLDNLSGNYSEDVLNNLKTTNLLSSSDYENEALIEQATKMIDTFASYERSEMNAEQGFVLSALTACCKDAGCAAKAKEQNDLPMSTDTPTIGK